MNVQAETTELNQLLDLIQRIESVRLEPSHLLEKDIKAFAITIQQLVNLSCISSRREHIKTATRHFFQNTINRMPNHVILPGNSGYRLHLKELENIDAALIRVNRALSKIGAINPTSGLSLQMPSDTPRYLFTDFAMHGLPQNLPEFIQSIDLKHPLCMSRWETHFKSCTTEILGIYLSQVTTSIQQNTNDDEVDAIMNTLHDFIGQLLVGVQDVEIRMFSDVAANGNRSPLRKQHKPEGRHVSFHSSTKTIDGSSLKHALNAELDKLLKTNATFNDHFAAFRLALSTAQEWPGTDIKTILHALETHLSDFRTSKKTPHHETVRQYINQCVNRISHPLPSRLRPRLDDLLAIYSEEHNHPFSLRKRYKLNFFKHLGRQYYDPPRKNVCRVLPINPRSAGLYHSGPTE